MRPLSGKGSQTSKYTDINTFVEAGRILANIIGVKQKAFMEQLWLDLVDATPVCTGYARASWFATPGIPKTKNPNGYRATTWDCKILYSYPDRPNLAKYKRNFSSWYIVNLAPYMEELNTGVSKQHGANYAGWINDIVSKNVTKAVLGQINSELS